MLVHSCEYLEKMAKNTPEIRDDRDSLVTSCAQWKTDRDYTIPQRINRPC